MNARIVFVLAVVSLAILSVTPLPVEATSYTWTGADSINLKAWESAANWSGGTYPNAYADTATIALATNNPVTLSTTALLGATSGNALTIGTGGSGTTANLDIIGSGTLGMQGPISITTPTSGSNKSRGITVEGTLRNDGASGTFYSISGTTTTGHGAETLTLNGGTIGSLNGGGWTFTSPVAVAGYGTISAPFSGTGTVTATSNNNALSITGTSLTPLTMTNPALAFSSTSPNGTGFYNLSYLNLTGVTLNGTSGRSQFTNLLPGAYNFNGTLNNNWGNNAYGLLNVTSDTTISGAITLSGGYKVFNITNSTLTLNNPGTIPTAAGNTSAPPAFLLGTGGNLTITGNNNLAFPSSSAPISVNGGSLAYTGTGTFSAYAFAGYGSVSGVTSIGGGGNVTAGGGTLNFTAGAAGLTLGIASGAGANLNSSASSTLDVKGKFNFIQPGFIAPNTGTINLDGATIALTVSPWVVTMNPGTINVTDNSFLTSVAGGSFSSGATLGIDSGKTLDISGATVKVTGGTLANSGTLAIGGGTLNNASTSTYAITGGGDITIAGGSIVASGTPTPAGFSSDNTVTGYGTVSAPFSNLGTVVASGGTLSFQGPVTQSAGNTLTGGTWKALAASTLDLATASNITTNQGNVVLDGVGSVFSKFDTLADNQGNFTILDGRDFSTVDDLANSGTVTVGPGSHLTVDDDITGTGKLFVYGTVNASSITQDSVTIGGTMAVVAVPEPATLVLLMLAGAALGLCAWKRP